MEALLFHLPHLRRTCHGAYDLLSRFRQARRPLYDHSGAQPAKPSHVLVMYTCAGKFMEQSIITLCTQVVLSENLICLKDIDRVPA